MAGEGQRFIDAGYKTPKPLIQIDGLPMAIRAAKCLPPADHWIFICRAHHVNESTIDEKLLSHFPDATILVVDHLTDGQACTCLLAGGYLKPDDQLTIGACDNSLSFDLREFETLIGRNDALVWTFRNNPVVLRNPTMYGWVSLNGSGGVNGVSCKKPISADPLHDHAVAGTFSFKNAGYFLECTNNMTKKNRRVNGEYYLDVVADECVLSGLIVAPFEVTSYNSWGTPFDLEKYHP